MSVLVGRFVFRFRKATGLAVLALAALLGGPVQAAAFVVNSTADLHDLALDGTCNAGGGACTLRAALEEAEIDAAGPTVITFNLPTPAVIQLTLGELRVGPWVAIHGPGVGLLEVRAGNASAPAVCRRVFRVLDFASVEIRDLTLADGAVVSGCQDEFGSTAFDDGGGALYNGGYTDLVNCRVTRSTAHGTEGGGGILSTEFLVIDHCVIDGNHADDAERGGGGILDQGFHLEILHSTVRDNRANLTDGSTPFEQGGGGLYSHGNFVFFDASTVSGNTSNDSRGGGGIYYQSIDSVMVNTTISGNTALRTHRGGGGLNNEESGTELYNCTISNNTTTPTAGAPPEGGQGGGVWAGQGGSLYYLNTIIAGNFAEGSDSGPFSDCYDDNFEIFSAGYNLTGGATGCRTAGAECAADFECDDFIFCNGTESCEDGQCASSGDPCIGTGSPRCDEGADVCLAACTLDAECDDGAFCNGTESCDLQTGACVNAGDACTLICDEIGDTCTPCVTDAQCQGGGPFCSPNRCESGVCVEGNRCQADGLACDFFQNVCFACQFDFQCSDFDHCNGGATCAAGICQPGVSGCASTSRPQCDLGFGCFADGSDKQVIDLFGVLDPLGNNGGPTRTHPLPTGSPAIDMGDPDGCIGVDFDGEVFNSYPLLFDQRGEPRPIDGDDDALAVCDIGAYEYQPGGGPGLVFSTLTGHWSIPPGTGFHFFRQNLYELVGGPQTFVQYGANFLPQLLNLDAVDVQENGDVLFSISAPAGNVLHGCGPTFLTVEKIYRYRPADGCIVIELDWNAVGVTMRTIDGIDKLIDGSYAFSVDKDDNVAHLGGITRLRPWNVYRYVPGPGNTKGTISLMLNAGVLGFLNVDGLDVLSDGRFALSAATDNFVARPGGILRIWQQSVYIYDPVNDTLVLGTDLGVHGVQNLDAFTYEVTEGPLNP